MAQKILHAANPVWKLADIVERTLFFQSGVNSDDPAFLCIGNLFKILLTDNNGLGFFERQGHSVLTGSKLSNVCDFRAILIDNS